jgi:TPR repeat protein
MNLVGRCCEEGWGRTRDGVAAACWYERSAQGGYFRGQYNWASHLLQTGRIDEAAHWFEQAAASGTPAVKEAVLKLISQRNGCPIMGALLTRLT